MSSIFTKIINQEIPSYKIYENEYTFAFLDIHPETKGHLLVVPKTEIDKIYDLDENLYLELFKTAKLLMRATEKTFNTRAIMKVIGTDIPHAHIHIMPLDETYQQGRTLTLSPEEFKSIQAKLEQSIANL